MTTIATSLERCTLITMHERAPHTVPQADPLAGLPLSIRLGWWFGTTRS